MSTEREIRKQAKAWMILNDIKSVDIQKALKMKSHTDIANTLAGRTSNKKVLQYLLDQGCPAEKLALPPKMKVAQ